MKEEEKLFGSHDWCTYPPSLRDTWEWQQEEERIVKLPVAVWRRIEELGIGGKDLDSGDMIYNEELATILGFNHFNGWSLKKQLKDMTRDRDSWKSEAVSGYERLESEGVELDIPSSFYSDEGGE
jgi:hypothetical protein